MQFAALVWFASFQWSRFALTIDFQVYYQAWLDIVEHHVYNPHISYPQPGFLIPNLYEFLFPLAAAAGAFSHSGLALKIYQAFCVVGAEAAALWWACDMLRRDGAALSARSRVVVGLATGFVVFALPWTYLACAFDYHLQPQAGLFATLSLWAFWRRAPRWGLLAAAALAATFIVGATFAVAIGLTVLICAPRQRLWGAGLTAGALVYLAILKVVFPAVPLGVIGTAYDWIGPHAQTHGLLGLAFDVIAHPAQILPVLAAAGANLAANVAPAGFLPLVCPWTALPFVFALIENGLAGPAFARPNFQYAIVYPLVAPAVTWAALRAASALHGRRFARPVLAAAALLLVVNAAGWALVWLPTFVPAWVPVRPDSAAVLARIHDGVPRDAQTIVSQGVTGRFGDKGDPMAFTGPFDVPLLRPEVAVVLTASQGVAIASPERTYAVIAALLDDPRATLVSHDAEIWWFRYRSQGLARLAVPEHPDTCAIAGRSGSCTPAVIYPGDERFARTFARPNRSVRATALGGPAFLVQNIYWRRDPGRYTVAVRASTPDGLPLAVNVRDVAAGTILATQSWRFGETATRTLDVEVPVVHEPARTFDGWGIFRVGPTAPTLSRVIELSVSAPAGSRGEVFSVGIAPG